MQSWRHGNAVSRLRNPGKHAPSIQKSIDRPKFLAINALKLYGTATRVSVLREDRYDDTLFRFLTSRGRKPNPRDADDEKNGNLIHFLGAEEKQNMVKAGDLPEHIGLEIEMIDCTQGQTTEPCVNGVVNVSDAAADVATNPGESPMKDHTSVDDVNGNLSNPECVSNLKHEPTAKVFVRWLARVWMALVFASIPAETLQRDIISGAQPNIPERRAAIKNTPFTSTSGTKCTTQVAVIVALVGGSFSVMLQVPGGVNESGSAVMGHTKAFKVFLVTNIVAFQASVVVCMTAATLSQIPSKLDYVICAALWVATMCFTVSFHAAVYVVLLSFAIFVIAMILLALYYLFAMP